MYGRHLDNLNKFPLKKSEDSKICLNISASEFYLADFSSRNISSSDINNFSDKTLKIVSLDSLNTVPYEGSEDSVLDKLQLSFCNESFQADIKRFERIVKEVNAKLNINFSILRSIIVHQVRIPGVIILIKALENPILSNLTTLDNV